MASNNLQDDTGYAYQQDIPPIDNNQNIMSPLMALSAPQGGSLTSGSSPIVAALLHKAEEIQPLKPEVEAKRAALQGAYQNLINAQQYQTPEDNLPGITAAAATFNAPGVVSPDAAAWSRGNLARGQEDYAQQEKSEKMRQAQAGTGIAAGQEGLREQEKDTANAMNLMQQAGMSDYRNAMLGARLNKNIKLPDGSDAIVNTSTGAITKVTDKHGNPVNGGSSGDTSTEQVDPVNGGSSGDTSTEQVDPDKKAIADQLGVPIAPGAADPTAGMTPQGRSTYMNKLQTVLQKNNENNQQIKDQVSSLDHFLDLNSEQKTGGWRNIPGVSSIETAMNPGWATMNSLNKAFSVGPGMRPTGMRVTQGEWNVFRQAVPSTSNPKEANDNIANAMKAKLQRDMDYNNFMSDYVTANGHGQMADNYFNKYMQDNPIFAPDASSKNNFKLNPDRMSYKDYFSKNSPSSNSSQVSGKIENPQAGGSSQQNVSGIEDTKEIDGESYYKRNGEWYHGSR